jgi:3,4-dihydroxy 2-butanone 4-phosphate synthase/GTP cyclohydrolase II
MARVPDLIPYCERHGLKMITVADLIAYRRRTEKLVERVVDTALPTEFGDFTAVGYRSLVDDKHHVAMVKGDVDGVEDVLVRVHSECLTGDVFHSMRCDCGEQLVAALTQIENEGRGVLLYLSQEGRGIGQAAGGGGGHGRGQPQARPARRPARLRDRRPDSR